VFDKYLIWSDSARNVEKDGEVVGFEFEVRITYYRGLRLSMVEGFRVSVDGEEYPREAVTFTVHGNSYALDEMETETVDRWEFHEPATLTIAKPGGLAPGTHAVEVEETLRISYMPIPSVATDKKQLSVAA
jgi:hypothetical protein